MSNPSTKSRNVPKTPFTTKPYEMTMNQHRSWSSVPKDPALVREFNHHP